MTTFDCTCGMGSECQCAYFPAQGSCPRLCPTPGQCLEKFTGRTYDDCILRQVDPHATPDRPANIISLGKWADIPEWTVRNCPSGFSVQRGEYGQGEEVVTTFVDLGHIKAIFENGLREWAPWVIADLRKILEEHDG